MGGKASVNLTGGATTNHVLVNIQPLTTYLDLLAGATNKIPYPVDVVGVGPYRYMLTDLNQGGEHTDGVIIFLHQIHPPAACIMFKHGSKATYEIPFDLKPATELTSTFQNPHKPRHG
ncbi:uncharacterized protein LOC110458489 [Mizuhopecten yessoensis]|uniref:uncharacterized protein LOC110458489 n=1 Tax=Mizuhopecten yessoensis TaxID=6573 RepID=UPI000B457B67|nr:uncharacterized protein LOC110458489 [Mizuhopecten yessoensis]